MPITLDHTAGARLATYLYAHIPLVRAMQVRIEAWDADGLELSAPLAANLNHEGTAFGGSLESLAVLACWGMLWLLLEDQPQMHIVIAESHTRFLQPVRGTLHAHCPMPEKTSLQTFLDTLQQHHKARIELHSRIIENGHLCASFEGQFAAYPADTHAH